MFPVRNSCLFVAKGHEFKELDRKDSLIVVVDALAPFESEDASDYLNKYLIKCCRADT